MPDICGFASQDLRLMNNLLYNRAGIVACFRKSKRKINVISQHISRVHVDFANYNTEMQEFPQSHILLFAFLYLLYSSYTHTHIALYAFRSFVSLQYGIRVFVFSMFCLFCRWAQFKLLLMLWITEFYYFPCFANIKTIANLKHAFHFIRFCMVHIWNLWVLNEN